MAIIDPDSNERMPLDHDLSRLYARELNAWSDRECKHNRMDLRRGFNKGGAPVVRQQCLDCGCLVGRLVKQTPETKNLKDIEDSTHPEYLAKRKDEKDAIARRYVALQKCRWRGSSEGRSYFQRSHAEYLSSPEWAERRQLVLDRSDGLCEGCRKERAAEVHHLTYRNWGNEFLFELAALCSACHDRVHRINEDRETGCADCVHAADHGEWCLQFGMPTDAALVPGGACGPERTSFVASEDYG